MWLNPNISMATVFSSQIFNDEEINKMQDGQLNMMSEQMPILTWE